MCRRWGKSVETLPHHLQHEKQVSDSLQLVSCSLGLPMPTFGKCLVFVLQEHRDQGGEAPSGGHEEDLTEQLKHFGQSLVMGTRELISQVSSTAYFLASLS